jgi:hypothetical protein
MILQCLDDAPRAWDDFIGLGNALSLMNAAVNFAAIWPKRLGRGVQPAMPQSSFAAAMRSSSLDVANDLAASKSPLADFPRPALLPVFNHHARSPIS